ncbi:MAG: hypothetical protein PHV74_12715 [Dehalococcoidia bacterium]|nr:hypothetical protein [Dehalococcoidia bacterium]
MGKKNEETRSSKESHFLRNLSIAAGIVLVIALLLQRRKRSG